MNKKSAYQTLQVAVCLMMTANISYAMDDRAAEPVEPAPIKVMADSIFFSDSTGAVRADGDIEIQQEEREIRTEAIHGNFKEERYNTVGLVSMKYGNTEDLKGHGLSYNAKTKSASFDYVEGYYKPVYLRGEGGLFVNNAGTLKKGMLTTPHAMAWVNPPDYRVEGENVHVYPGDKVVIKDAKFFIKNWNVLTLPSYKVSLRKKEHGMNPLALLPRPTYSSDNGFGLYGKMEYPLYENLDLDMEYYWYQREGFKPSVGLQYYLPWGRMFAGYEEVESRIDDRRIWIKKSPEISLSLYNRKLGSTPLTVKSFASWGKWSEENLKGTHYVLQSEVSHDPISLGKEGTLQFAVGYQLDYYGVTQSYRHMPYWHVHLAYPLRNNIMYKFSYRHQENGDKSPYLFDRYSLLKKMSNEVKIQLDRLNAVSVEVIQDVNNGKLDEIIYTYYRDLHSFEGELLYHAKKDKWQVNFYAKDF